MKKILLATGIKVVNKTISQFPEFEVVGVTDYREHLLEAIQKTDPEIVVVSEWLSGKENIIELLLSIPRINQNIRIVFLSHDLNDRDKFAVNRLATLVMAGIYDISHQSKINKNLLHHLLVTPKEKDDVKYLLKYMNEETNEEVLDIKEIQDVEDIQEDGYKNVFTVSSIKPGTGKSFISANVASIIAKYGKKKDGKPPKVALVEADLQNLSIGTILQIEDDKRNIKSVMDKIDTLLDSEGNLKADEMELESANAFIKKCFVSYRNIPNLDVLAGSELTVSELQHITANHYVYLIDVISDVYDVVIIDTNSSLAHVTTHPLLQLSNTCFYILNLDFNNVRNNARYRNTLKDLGILHKVKYLLNQDITDDSSNDLIFNKQLIDKNEFKLEASIPQLPLALFYNKIYEGTPICLDESVETLKARLELTKVANQIWDIDNLNDLQEAVDYYSKNKKETKKKHGLFDKNKDDSEGR